MPHQDILFYDDDHGNAPSPIHERPAIQSPGHDEKSVVYIKRVVMMVSMKES